MINGMLESSRGCLKEEIKMDIISNNLANSSVIGFKKNRISFQKMLEQSGMSKGGIDAPSSGNALPIWVLIEFNSSSIIRI